MNHRNTETAFIVALFIISFGIRFLFVDEAATSSLIAVNALRGTDMEGYLRWGAALSRGLYESESAYWQAPLYPYFLSAVFRLSGVNIYIAALVQVFLSAMTCVLIYLVSREAFNRRTAAAAGIISCFYGPLIFYPAILLSETLAIFLIASALYFLVKYSSGPEKPGFAAAGGALLGLASLARPNFLLFAPFFLLFMLLKQKCAGKRAARAAFFILPLVVAVLPATIRNYAVSGEFVPISANFFETFRLSNSYDSLVLNYTEPRLPLMPFTSGAFWLHQLRKALYFWWGYEVPQNVNYYLFAEYSTILNLPLFPFWLAAPFGLAGVVFWLRSGYRKEKTLLIFVLTFYASIIMLYICSRFRLPVMAGLIPFAGFGAVRIIDYFRSGKFWSGFSALLACAVMSAAIYPWGHPRIRGTDYRMVGIALAREGLYREALEPLKKSLGMLPPEERKATLELINRLEEFPPE